MRAGSAALAVVLVLAGSPARGASRLVVWAPEGSALAPELPAAFAWAAAVDVLDRSTIATRFPPSPTALDLVEREALAARIYAEAERAFVATKFSDAKVAVERCLGVLEALPPSASTQAEWVRAQLLLGRVELARGNDAMAAAAFRAAAAGAPELVLDEAEYPPEVRAAYAAAQREVLDEPPRTLIVRSDPPDAEVELNGRAVGRTPVEVRRPPGRCVLSIVRPRYERYLASCPGSGDVMASLLISGRSELKDLLRERLTSDPRWFVEPPYLDALAYVLEATWVLVLEPGRGQEVEARLFWTLGGRFVPVTPARYGPADAAKLGAAVRDAVRAAEGLAVELLAPLPGSLEVHARAGDPGAVARAVLMVRRKGARAWRTVELAARPEGRFAGSVPRAEVGDPAAALELEYYVEGYDANGTLVSRVGAPDEPLVYRRAAAPGAPVQPAGPAWYRKWWVWTIAGAVVAGASVGGWYLLRPTDYAVRF